MKVRLVGGPFGGQVKEIGSGHQYGRNEVILRGPKKMTRKQKWDFMRDNQGQWSYGGTVKGGGPVMFAPHAPMPIVEARYRLAMRPHHNGYQVANLPCMHPDGSLFYEYVDKSKRDL